jgi:hypothetical protein
MNCQKANFLGISWTKFSKFLLICRHKGRRGCSTFTPNCSWFSANMNRTNSYGIHPIGTIGQTAQVAQILHFRLLYPNGLALPVLLSGRRSTSKNSADGHRICTAVCCTEQFFVIMTCHTHFYSPTGFGTPFQADCVSWPLKRSWTDLLGMDSTCFSVGQEPFDSYLNVFKKP